MKGSRFWRPDKRFSSREGQTVVAPRREGVRDRGRVRCGSYIGGTNYERKSRLGRPDWVKIETTLEGPSDWGSKRAWD